jgi:hypothetical protein
MFKYGRLTIFRTSLLLRGCQHFEDASQYGDSICSHNSSPIDGRRYLALFEKYQVFLYDLSPGYSYKLYQILFLKRI